MKALHACMRGRHTAMAVPVRPYRCGVRRRLAASYVRLALFLRACASSQMTTCQSTPSSSSWFSLGACTAQGQQGQHGNAAVVRHCSQGGLHCNNLPRHAPAQYNVPACQLLEPLNVL